MSAAVLLWLLATARAGSLEGPDCRVVYPDSARASAERVFSGFSRRRAEAAAWLGAAPAGRPEIHLVEDYSGMVAAAGPVPAWALAITRSDDLLVFRLDKLDRGPASRLELVLKHEIVHQVLNHYCRGAIPRWFEEGLCVHWAGIPYLNARSSIPSMAAAGTLPTLDQTSRSFRGASGAAGVAYEQSKSAVDFFLKEHGPDTLRRLLRAAHDGEMFDEAFAKTTGETLPQFEERWRRHVTPALPFWVDFFLRNLQVSLLSFGGLLVFIGYVRYRLKRPKALAELDFEHP